MEKKSFHSLRVADENWIKDERFAQLLSLLEKYPSVFRQIALFTSPVHSPLTLDEFQRRINIAAKRLPVLRKKGFSVGINILATIGHHEEDLDHVLQGDFYHMTNREGKICRGSYCMNDARYLKQYVSPIYAMTAEIKPDFIWIDDDVRYGHLPVGVGCYCDACIAKFNREHDTSFTRDMLIAALDNGNIDIRKKWMEHNRFAICNMFSLIEKTVHTISPKTVLGFMTGERYNEGYDFPKMAEALSDGGKYPLMWRPGGGSYEDYCFDDIIKKSEQIGRQCAYLPENVTSVQSEIENFPYQLLKKSPTSTALESAWYMTAGCTGAAFNILPSETGEPINLIAPHIEALEATQPLYRLLSQKTAGLQPCGIAVGWSPKAQVAVPQGNYDMISGDCYASFARELFDFGLPQCYLQQNACVTVATGTFGIAWEKEALDQLFSKGLYISASALDYLNKCGYGKKLGMTVESPYPVDARECYLEAEINQGFVGGLRNCRQAFYFGDSFGITLQDQNALSLASLIDYHNKEKASCSMGIFENDDGGRVCTAGYYPFSSVSDCFKTRQLKRLFLWLSKNTLPSFVDSYARIRNHTFCYNGKTVVALCNPSNENLKNLRVAVKGTKKSGIWYLQNGSSKVVLGEEAVSLEGYTFFILDEVPAFQMALLEV